MSDLLTKSLAYYDPIHRGWTRKGIAAGGRAMFGRGLGRVHGGYRLYRGLSIAAIDMSAPVGCARHDATTILPWPWIAMLPGTLYCFRLIAVGPGGVESVENTKDRQVVWVRTDDAGDVPEPVPPAPRRLRADPLAGGCFRVSFYYQPSKHFQDARQFCVYSDGGAGTVDYETPMATIAARVSDAGRGEYAWDSEPFEHAAWVKWAVRAATNAGDEEQNVLVVSAQADAEGPAGLQIVAVSYGGDA